MYNSSVYIVRKGDNLLDIARNFGFRSWEVLYNANCNKDLKGKRPNPQDLRPGDIINIPTDVVKAARQRVEVLRKTRKDIEDMYDGYLKEWDKEHKNMLSFTTNIEIASFVANIFVSLTKIVRLGYKSMELAGEKLTKLNKELVHSAFDLAYDPIKEAGRDYVIEKTGILDLKPSDGPILGLSKRVSKFVINCESPTYWASIITNVDVDKVYQSTRSSIIESKERDISFLNSKIGIAERFLRKQTIHINSLNY